MIDLTFCRLPRKQTILLHFIAYKLSKCCRFFLVCLLVCLFPSRLPCANFSFTQHATFIWFFKKHSKVIRNFCSKFFFSSKIRCWCGLLCSDLWLCGGERTVIRPRRRSCVTTAALGSWRGASWSRCRIRSPASGTRDSKPTHPIAASASASSCSLRSVQTQPEQNCRIHAYTTGIGAVLSAHILRVRYRYPILVSVSHIPNFAVAWKDTL